MTEHRAEERTHAVWEVYDEHRDACLNAKYYSHYAVQYERYNFGLDLVTFFSTPTSAVAGLAFFDTAFGHGLFAVMATIAAFSSTIKIGAKLQDKVKALDQTVSGYQAMVWEMKEIGHRIRAENKYSRSSIVMFESSVKKAKELAKKPPIKGENRKLIEKLMLEVEQQLPNSCFFIPKENNGNQAHTPPTISTAAPAATTATR